MNKTTDILLRLLLLVAIAFYAVGLLMPAYWSWSVFALPGLTQIQVAILGLVLILVLIPSLSSAVYRMLSRWFENISKGLKRLPSPVKAILWIGVPFVLLYLLRTNAHIYGDSQNLIGSIVSGEVSSPFYNRIGMLMQVIAKPFGLVGNTREAAGHYVAVLSITAGVVFMYFSWKAFGLLIDKRGRAVMAYLAVVTSGIIVIFAGYIEAYSIIIAWLSVYIYYSIRYLQGQGKSSVLVLIFLIGLFWHFWFIAFSPSLIYVLNRRLKILNNKSLITIGIIFTIVIYFLGQIIKRGEFPLTIPFLPTDQSNYWLFSPAHFADIANQLIVVGPILAVLGLLLYFLYKKEEVDDSHRFLLWAGLPALAISFMIDPHLGAARDWDLLSIFAVPLIILGAVLLLNEKNPKFGYLLIAVLLFNIVHTGSILTTNKNQDYAVDRIIGITLNDPHYQTDYYGAQRNRALSVILVNEYHKYDDAIRLLKRKVDSESATVYDAFLLANYSYFAGKYRDAVGLFDLVADKTAFTPQERFGYGYSLYSAGEYSRAIDQFRLSLRDTCSSEAGLYAASSFAYDYQLDSCKKYCEISIRCSRDPIQAMHDIVLYLPRWVFPRLKAQYESRVLAAYPDSVEIRNNLISLFEWAGMPDSAHFYMNYKKNKDH